MNINLHNYESCFHLYVDGELDAGEMAAVEAFAAQYPHLGEELEQLMQTILPAPQMTMPHKSKLLRPEPWDAEHLTPAQLLMLEQLESGALHQFETQEARLLKLTVLPPEAITMPGKQKLYREETPVRIAPIWNLNWVKRMAAAAAVIAATWALWPSQAVQVPAANPGSAPDVAAQTPEAAQTLPAAPNATSATTPAAQQTTESGTLTASQPDNIHQLTLPGTTTIVPPVQHMPQDILAHQPQVVQPGPVAETTVLPAEPLVATTEPALPLEQLVTDEPAEEAIDAMPNDAETDAEAYVNVGGVKIKKSRFRGIMRTVSRNISRRTSAEQLQQAILPR